MRCCSSAAAAAGRPNPARRGAQVSWAIGFAIPAVAMAIAVLVFVSGSSLYTHVEPTERRALLLREHAASFKHCVAAGVRV